jgi:hypothetical protein
MRLRIIEVTPLEKYKLFVRFSDGVEGAIDLSHLAGKGVFQSWEKNEDFYKVFISPESHAITWPGEIDIDTYKAYCTIKGINPEDYFKSEQQHATHL